jgi:hypothetical protein
VKSPSNVKNAAKALRSEATSAPTSSLINEKSHLIASWMSVASSLPS